jgi:Nucleoside 2-deoxyribosyltransferase like
MGYRRGRRSSPDRCPALAGKDAVVRHVQPPQEYAGGGPKLFLAGGITGCPDWQHDAVQMLRDVPELAVLNPRRTPFPVDDPDAAVEQIGWEFRHLHRADVVLFWFAGAPSDQPIVWYELGVHAATGRVPVAVGADPVYHRRRDVALQLALAQPGLPVHATFAATVAAARTLLPPA